jgi:hypothetical protein
MLDLCHPSIDKQLNTSYKTAVIRGKIKVSQKEMEKRYNKIVANLISKIETNFPIVIIDSTKIEELHDLNLDE